MVLRDLTSVFSTFMNTLDAVLEQHPGISLVAVGRLFKGFGLMFFTYITGYVVLKLVMHAITNFCHYKVNMIDYEAEKKIGKHVKRPELKLFAPKYILKLKMLFVTTIIVVTFCYVVGSLIEPVGAAVVPNSLIGDHSGLLLGACQPSSLL